MKTQFRLFDCWKLWKKIINATKSKKQKNLSFPVIVHINWKSIENAGEKMKKMKVREIFWNTKIHLSFQSSSAAALIKKLSDGKFIKFFGTSGHSFWIRANCRWFGQRRVEKSPTEWPVSKQSIFCRAIFLQQGGETCLRCARKNSLSYKVHTENEIITTKIGLIPENLSNFEKKLRESEQKRFGSVARTETYMSKCLSCEKYFLEAKT